MSKPLLSKKFLDQLYDMNILDPDQDPMKQFQEMQNLQLLYDSGKAPMESTPDPDRKNPQATSTPSSSKDSEHSTQDPVQTLFADRARRLETDKRDKEAAGKAQRKAEALAKKEATSRQQGPAMSKQAKYAQEEIERLKEEKVAKERVLRQIEVDKVERREREERRKEAVRAESDGHSSRPSKPLVPSVLPQSSRDRSSTINSRRRDRSNISVDAAPSPPSSSRSRPAYSGNTGPDQDSTSGDYDDGQFFDEDYTNEDYTLHGGNHKSGGRSRSKPNLPPKEPLSRPGNPNPGRTTGDYDDRERPRYCVDCARLGHSPMYARHMGNGQWRCEGPCGGGGSMEPAIGAAMPGWNWAGQESLSFSTRRSRAGFLTRDEGDAARSRSPLSVPRSGSSRPFPSEGIRLGGPRGPPEISYGQLPSSPTARPGHTEQPSPSISPRAATSTSSRPSPGPGINTIERFDQHESAKEDPAFSSDLERDCRHPPHVPRHCSYCDRGRTSVCMPCVVRGCAGQWCDECWDAMVTRKRAVGARLTRPPGWQECRYRGRKPDRGSRGRW